MILNYRVKDSYSLMFEETVRCLPHFLEKAKFEQTNEYIYLTKKSTYPMLD